MRVHGWEERLLATVAAETVTPFDWQRGGCIGFALDCIEAVTGENPMPGLSFGDAKDARRVLKDMAADDLRAALAKHLDPVPVSMAQRGDVGVVTWEGAQCAVVNIGPVWTGKSETGLVRVPRAKVEAAFKV